MVEEYLQSFTTVRLYIYSLYRPVPWNITGHLRAAGPVIYKRYIGSSGIYSIYTRIRGACKALYGILWNIQSSIPTYLPIIYLQGQYHLNKQLVRALQSDFSM